MALRSQFAPCAIRDSTMTRATYALFASIVVSVLLISAYADGSNWKPSEQDLKDVVRAELIVRL